MRSFSGLFRLAFIVVIGGMIVLAVFALLTRGQHAPDTNGGCCPANGYAGY
jgi:hypothetical protein